jgi:hypothetical protein
MEKNIKIGDKIYSVASDDNYLDAIGESRASTGGSGMNEHWFTSLAEARVLA